MMMKKIKIISFLLFIFFTLQSFAQDVVCRIDVTGNKVVSESTILTKIKLRAGQPYNENIINEDIKNLYASGFFSNVEAEKETADEGIVVVFKVKEKPVLKKIDISGAHHVRKNKIQELLELKEGSFVDDYVLSEAMAKIKNFYIKKGFSQVNISYKTNISEEKNTADVEFIIEERKILKVRGVTFEGNKSILYKRILKVMKTKKAWLFNKGIFKEEILQDDIKRVSDFYRSEGFSDVQVNIDKKFEKEGVYITVKIEEGKRYYIGEINIEGNKDVVAEEIKKAIVLKSGDVFSEQAVYESVSRAREIYVDKGYIFAQIEPLSYFNIQTQKVDVTYSITENQIADIEKIDIRGNVKTKDEVIRRELRVYPGERFDGKKVRKSKERLENLGFFEEIRFSTDPGSDKNKVNLLVDVKETKTGYLSFGGGYSSINEIVGFVEIRQRNFDYRNFSTFTGAGQDLSLMASFGTLTDNYQLSFTNPWIFDRPVSFGFDAYKRGHRREEDVGYAYDEDVGGGALRLGREFNDYLKGGLAYRFERINISDIIDDASQELKDEKGINNLSSGEVNLSFDQRDNVFSPSKGVYFVNTFQTTGGIFGGDKDFFKDSARVSFYFPMINKSVTEFRLTGGWSSPFSNTDKVPLYERFFAGGASTIRGYHERKIGPIDTATEDPIGGESMFVSNLEYTYPLIDFLKVAAFFDTGNVWKEKDDFLSGDLKSSIGCGLRVKTPIGPISLDYGLPLDLEPGEEDKEGRFHFNISRGF